MIKIKNLNIIIDTDPGTDDALALGVAAAYFKNNIRALISTYGNVDGEQTYSNLVNLAGILNINCEIIKGNLTPFGKDKDSLVYTDYHGKNGLCGLELPTAPVGNGAPAVPLPSVYDMIKKHKPIKYIAIGPLTNISELLEKFPDSVNYIDELIIMGGGFDVSNMENDAEFNFSMDPVAVRKVLASPVKKVIAPLDMTHLLAFSLSDIEDITGANRDILAKIFYLNYETSVKHGNQGAIIHDATTLAYLFDKSKCDLQSYKIISDEYGAVRKHSDGYSVTVIEKIDREYIKNLLRGVFA